MAFSSACNEKKSDANNSSNLSNNSIAVTAIKDVIQNKKEFILTENNKPVFIKNYDSINCIYRSDDGSYEYINDDEKIENSFNQFCVIDIDKDGNPEALLECGSSNILVLHYENDAVYGFAFPYRGMCSVKKDGSYRSSGGAVSVYIDKIKFSGSKCTFEELCCLDEYDTKNPYRINQQKVSKKEAEEYRNNFDNLENAEWYTYNQANLEKYLTK